MICVVETSPFATFDICLGKCFKMIIKEKYRLDNDADVAEQLIPSTFEEETNL
jgi:hypothetical protein